MGPPLAEVEHQRASASVPGVGVGAQENAARPEGQPGETQEAGVSEFDDLEKKAEAYAEEHPRQADKGINEVAGFAERNTDHQHDEQIDRAVDAAERHIGRRQERQGNQDRRQPGISRKPAARRDDGMNGNWVRVWCGCPR